MSIVGDDKELVSARLEHAKCPGSACTVNLLGAHITSWKIMGKEMLWMSTTASEAEFKQALRGGVPVIFPQFGPGPMKQHGFARLVKWTMPEMPAVNVNTGDVTATFVLTPSPFSKEMWNKDFTLSYQVVLKETSLAMQLTVENTGSEEFSFTTLLHTYFGTEDITKTTITGLKGKTFTDKLDGGNKKIESEEYHKFEGAQDRIYENVNNEITIADGGNAVIVLKSSNLNDYVVWNPWAEGAKTMADFDDLGYKNMVCVEAGQVTIPVLLAPGQKWAGAHGISLSLRAR